MVSRQLTIDTASSLQPPPPISSKRPPSSPPQAATLPAPKCFRHESAIAGTSSRHAIKQEPSTDIPSIYQFKRKPSINTSSIHPVKCEYSPQIPTVNNVIELTSSEDESPSRRSPSIISISSTSPSPGPAQRKWPGSFHVIDIVKCYDDCFVTPGSRTSRQIFLQHFGRYGVGSYPKSSFYAHQQRWMSAPQELKDHFMAAGRGKEGLWSSFMAIWPTRDPKLINVFDGRDD